MVWGYGEKVPFPQNLALICLTVSEKTGFTHGRTTDARVTVALLCSSTKQS